MLSAVTDILLRSRPHYHGFMLRIGLCAVNTLLNKSKGERLRASAISPINPGKCRQIRAAAGFPGGGQTVTLRYRCASWGILAELLVLSLIFH